MTHDGQLTILLVVKDRVPFTFRWMSYANDVRLPFHVCIADGGADDDVQRILSNRANFPHVKYEYVRYPLDRTYSDYFAKVADALSRIHTPLVAMAANKDFFIIDGLGEAAAFLMSHADYVTCGGQCAAFWVDGSTMCERESTVYGQSVDWKCIREPESRSEDTARARLRNPVLWGHAIYTHVRRTELQRAHFNTLRELAFSHLFLHEQMIECLTAIAGRSKVLDTLYVARQWNAPDSGGRAHLDAFGGWLGCMLEPTWSDDFGKFVRVTSEALAERDGLTLDEARRYMIETYRMEMAPAILGDVLKEPTVSAPMSLVAGVARRFLALSPDSVARRIARALYRRLRWIPVDAVRGTELRSRRVPDAHRDIKPIHEFLTRHSPPGGLSPR